MAILEGVKVVVAWNTTGMAKSWDSGEALPEYHIPDAIDDPLQASIEKYIEAIPGRAFQIEVFLSSGFRLYTAHGIEVSLLIDDGTFRFSHRFPTQEVIKTQDDEEPLIISCITRSKALQDRVGTKYCETGFTFGHLRLGKDL